MDHWKADREHDEKEDGGDGTDDETDDARREDGLFNWEKGASRNDDEVANDYGEDVGDESSKDDEGRRDDEWCHKLHRLYSSSNKKWDFNMFDSPICISY